MARYRLTLAYDGTDFHGWQKQDLPVDGAGSPRTLAPHESFETPSEELAPPPGRAALRTIQEVVERAVREVIREPILLQGASRTDSGVHARAQVAAFSCSDDRVGPPEERLAQAIDSRLPEDVVVVDCRPAAEAFDPIGDCVSKGYRYALHTGFDRPLWDRRFVHHVRAALDDERMREAAARLVGEHDFAAFAAAGHGRLSTVRTVLACDVRRLRDDRILIDVAGTGFLHNMVRIIAGTLVEVGRGKMTPDDVTKALESGDRRDAGPTLPSTGLCLEWIRYKGEPDPLE